MMMKERVSLLALAYDPPSSTDLFDCMVSGATQTNKGAKRIALQFPEGDLLMYAGIVSDILETFQG
jgi:hypothetical protein